MLNIRSNCFETNSSSAHSFIISKVDKGQYTEEELEEGFYIDDGEVRLWDCNLEFGRSPFAILTTFKDKLCYLIAETCNSYTPPEADDYFNNTIMPIVREIYPEIQEITFDERIDDVYVDANGNTYPAWECKYVGYENEEFMYVHVNEDGTETPVTRSDELEEVGNNYGYIDHQSSGMLTAALEKHNISIKDFLANKEYMVVIDGDEYCQFENLINHHIIRIDDFIVD